METLGVAVVGCGRFGEFHAAAYARFHRSRLVTVCDLDEAKARGLAETWDCAWTTRLEDVLADERVRAVSVATPDFAHRDVCCSVAAAGKHLLVEKPLATSVEDAEAIAKAVADAGVLGCVDFHNRYHPGFRTLKRKLDDGKLGAPCMLFARLSDRIEVATEWFAWSSRSGPQWFLGSHLVDLACWLMGERPVRVYAEGRKGVLSARGIDCYDCLQIHLGFPGGPATLETSWILPDTWPSVADFFVSVQTTEGRADYDGSRQGMTLSSARRHEWPFLHGMTAIGEDDFGYFHLPMRDFVRAVLEGRPSPMPLKLGLENVRIVDAALRSIEMKSVVEL